MLNKKSLFVKRTKKDDCVAVSEVPDKPLEKRI